MTVTTSPRLTSRLTERNTSTAPKALETLRTSSSAGLAVEASDIVLFPDEGEAPLEPPAGERERVVDREVDERAQYIERHRLIGAADDLVDGLHQVGDAEQRHQCAALDRVGD